MNRKEMMLTMNEWLNHPTLKDMDPIKVELIKMAAKQADGKSGKELAPVMMSLIGNANKQKIHFTGDEIDLIFSVLKEGKSKKEQAEIDKTIQLVHSFFRKKA